MSLSSIIQAVTESYKKLNDEIVCSFGLVGETESYEELIGEKDPDIYFDREICHGSLSELCTDEYDELVTSWNVDTQDSLRFFDFMKYGLYRNWKDFFNLCQTEEGKYYLHFTDLSKIPAPVVMNMCICSRIPHEHPGYLDIWARLVEDGINPAIAFATCRAESKITHFMIGHNRYATIGEPLQHRVISSAGTFVEHWPLNNSVSIERLVAGDPDVSGYSSFKEHPAQSIPTNRIWDVPFEYGGVLPLRQLEGTTIHKFQEAQGLIV